MCSKSYMAPSRVSCHMIIQKSRANLNKKIYLIYQYLFTFPLQTRVPRPQRDTHSAGRALQCTAASMLHHSTLVYISGLSPSGLFIFIFLCYRFIYPFYCHADKEYLWNQAVPLWRKTLSCQQDLVSVNY